MCQNSLDGFTSIKLSSFVILIVRIWELGVTTGIPYSCSMASELSESMRQNQLYLYSSKILCRVGIKNNYLIKGKTLNVKSIAQIP